MQRTMRTVVTLLLLTALPLSAMPSAPGPAVQQARQHIAAKRYTEAVQTLAGALAGIEKLDPADREKAAAAVHFYTAVALSGLKSDREATDHLREFFALVPSARLSSPEKYESHFVELFRNSQPRNDNAEFRFDNFYPGFTALTLSKLEDANPARDSSAIAILASIAEKQQWESTMSSIERTRLLEEFWKRRDPRPETSMNEFRDTFNRRAEFADQAFGSSGERGSTTDRGRVFVLLGVPSSVHRRPLTPLDPVIVVESSVVINGTVEQWVYTNEQLPIRLTKKYVGYRFITQKGIGDNVLQREDPYAFQALVVAMNPNQYQKQ